MHVDFSPPVLSSPALSPTLSNSNLERSMLPASGAQGGELFIVDNSDDAWKGLRYLQDWTEIASAFDIAAGYFEIGALLAMDGQVAEGWRRSASSWVTRPQPAPRAAVLEGLQSKVKATLDASLGGRKGQERLPVRR